MENKMRYFKVLSVLLLLLAIGNTFKQHGAMLAPMITSPAVPPAKPEFAFPMACRIEATDSAKVSPTIDLGTVQLNDKAAPSYLTVKTEESGMSMVWLKMTSENRHEIRKVFTTYIIIESIFALLLLVLTILILVSTCTVLWNFTRERIFTHKQSKRLTRLGIYLLISGLLSNALCLFSHYYTASHLSIVGWNFIMPNLLLGDIIVALLILLFNEMLKHSILLKEEQSLTI